MEYYKEYSYIYFFDISLFYVHDSLMSKEWDVKQIFTQNQYHYKHLSFDEATNISATYYIFDK